MTIEERFYSLIGDFHVGYTPLKDFWKAEALKGLTCYLLRSGIVMPPVEVGQKVWYIRGGYYNSAWLEPCEIEVTEISKKKCGKIIDLAFIANGSRYKFDSFGKTVFWTKEECEAAIEKRKKGR